jgi:hypothetical protein
VISLFSLTAFKGFLLFLCSEQYDGYRCGFIICLSYNRICCTSRICVLVSFNSSRKFLRTFTSLFLCVMVQEFELSTLCLLGRCSTRVVRTIPARVMAQLTNGFHYSGAVSRYSGGNTGGWPRALMAVGIGLASVADWGCGSRGKNGCRETGSA